MDTVISSQSPQSAKRWANALAVDVARKSYFTKFTGSSENSIIQEKVELTKDAGDEIVFDLNMSFREKPVYGDNIAEGNEEGLTFLQDAIKIDQVRKPANGGGRMTRQRTLHDLRKLMKDRTGDFMSMWADECTFVYLSGDAGNTAMNEDKLFTETSFAGNTIEAPDAAHITYGGDATEKADLAAADKMSVTLIERVSAKVSMLRATDPNVVDMKPIKEGSESHFIMLMNDWQKYDLRTGTDSADWVDIQKAAGQRGSKNPLFSGQMGMVGGVSLHAHSNVRRFDDYGAGGNVNASRALFMGAQAGVKAYGRGSGAKMSWVEKLTDYDNQVSIAAGMICGVKKTRFKNASGVGSDFGIMAVDTAAAPVT
jgi:N4-gp56 family major capsid protein